MPGRTETTSRDSPGMIPYGCPVSLLPGFYERPGQKQFTFHLPGIQPFLPTQLFRKKLLRKSLTKTELRQRFLVKVLSADKKLAAVRAAPQSGTAQRDTRRWYASCSNAYLRLRSSAIGSGREPSAGRVGAEWRM